MKLPRWVEDYSGFILALSLILSAVLILPYSIFLSVTFAMLGTLIGLLSGVDLE